MTGIDYRKSSLTGLDRAVRMFGWFSLGLGLAELIAPQRIGRIAGVDGHERLIRGYGAREMMAGVGVLSTNPAPAMWARAAGDVLDLATIARGRGDDDRLRRNARIGMAVAAGFALADAALAALVTRQNAREAEPPRDYRDRSGFPKGKQAARGAAKKRAKHADVPPMKPDLLPA